MFLQGVASNGNLDCSSASGHWRGGNFGPVACHPLDPQKLTPQQLVLSPHVYGPDVYAQSYFGAVNFPANMPAIWDQHFGYLRARAYYLVVGEFGGQYGNGGGDPADRVWQDALVDYLIDRGITNTIYWSWNPTSGDTAGILKDDWQGVWDNKMTLLRRLWGAAPPPDSDADGVPDAQDNCRLAAGRDRSKELSGVISCRCVGAKPR